MTTFPVFMIYGQEHVSYIRKTLIPALSAQSVDMDIHLHLLNFRVADPLFDSNVRYGKVTVFDQSAAKPVARTGFGEGMNFLFECAQPEQYFFILNPDTMPDSAVLEQLLKRFVPGKSGILEARQWPSEHPKEYDTTTGQTPWASGACVLIAADFFRKVGGFDPIYFMYCEDVDLSWQAWMAGRTVEYVPQAGVMHFTGLHSYRTDRFYLEHYYSARNFLLLLRKYFHEEGERIGLQYLALSGYPAQFKDAVRASYASAKPYVKMLEKPASHPMIKVYGFNTYHELRPIAA